ncbi:MAG: hypothetical protein CMJ40_00905 [Phycisphaerae bacterium]|nr:hypothetical protein [Phycisphaerae bacterium]|tara:strand:+ start:783 stop:2279 length:1497 start_codon:yes stop_codon:yes gene_type:complete
MGCLRYKLEKTSRPSTRHLEVRHEAHGTSYATVVDEDLWYVTQGNRLLVLDPITGRQISETDLGRGGETGPAVDLLVTTTDIYVVMRDTSVVSLGRTDPRRPWIETRWDVETLGIEPRSIHRGRNGPIVCGLGGAVLLPDLKRIVDHHDEVTSVVELGEESYYASGRRVYRISDDTYIGSATSLESLPPSDGGGEVKAGGSVLPEDVMLFTRNESMGGLAGFAYVDDAILREVDSRHGTEAFSGGIRRIHAKGDRVLIISQASIHLYRIDHRGHLGEIWSQKVNGARDAGFMGDDEIVVVGDFGQARYGTKRQGDSLEYRHDSPGGLIQAVSDGRSIVATGVDGTWKYNIGHEAELVTDQIRLFPPPPRAVATLGWEIAISPDGKSAVVSNQFGEAVLPAPVDSLFTTVTAAEGSFWLGHHKGIMMLKPPKQSAPVPNGWDDMTPEEQIESGYSVLQGFQKLSVMIDGPVIFIQPLDLGGGVAYAATNDGFGVVRESW